MKHRMALHCGILLAGALMAGSPAFAGWEMVNLAPSGSASSVAKGGNGNLQAGNAVFNNVNRAVVWNGSSTYVDLTPTNATSSSVNCVQGDKQGGSVIINGVQRACYWSGTSGTYVDRSPGPYGRYGYIGPSEIRGMYNGAAVGYVTDYNWGQQATYWTATGGMIWLDAFRGVATGIYGDQIVGNRDNNQKATIWGLDGKVKVDLNGSAITSAAYGIYGNQQVGESLADTNEPVTYGMATLWTGTAWNSVNLNPAGSLTSVARAVYDGKQAGRAMFNGQWHAGVWSGTADSWIDLHPAGATSSQAESIFTQNGEIWVTGLVDNKAAMWHYAPVPEPGTMMAMLSGLVPLGFVIKRRRM